MAQQISGEDDGRDDYGFPKTQVMRGYQPRPQPATKKDVKSSIWKKAIKSRAALVVAALLLGLLMAYAQNKQREKNDSRATREGNVLSVPVAIIK